MVIIKIFLIYINIMKYITIDHSKSFIEYSN